MKLRRRELLPWLFRLSAAGILFLSGLAKLWGGLGDAKLMLVEDPISGLSLKTIALTVGVMELVVAAVCVVSASLVIAAVCVAWLTIHLLLYRLALWWLEWDQPCGCFGNLPNYLGVSPLAADIAGYLLLSYLALGSSAMLWRVVRTK